MDKSTLIRTIKEYLKVDNFQNVFELLDNNLKNGTAKYNDFIALNRRFNRNKTAFFNGTLERELYLIEDNKITDSAINLVDNLREEDIKEDTNEKSKDCILNPILVVCENIEDQKYMQEFFILLNFEMIKVEVSQSLLPVEDIDLIIFDNRYLKDCPMSSSLANMNEEDRNAIQNRIELMKNYEENSDKFFIHFGERLFWLNDQRERFYAANSKFSLYARTEEMINFINRYKT